MKTTLILLLLPLTALCQTPPCLTGNFVWQGGYEFGIAFPDDGCQYIASWQDDYIDCHGAMNRYLNFQRINIASDTTITVQAGTFPLTPTSPQPDPTDLVFTFWDACPFQGGNTVASIACGGWDCIEWGEVGFTATLTLEAGVYWFWAGLYSDGVDCASGIVQGVISTGGSCPDEPEPLPSPCPTYTITEGNTTITYCGEQTGPPIDFPENPCGQIDMYVTVEFTTDGSLYPIEIVSDVNYVDFPNTPINQMDILILDGCDGNLIATSHNGACALGAYCGENSAATEYTAAFCLPAGTYIAVIGYMNHTDLPFGAYLAQEGCVSYTFGQPTFLDGAEPPQELPNVSEHEYHYVPRYTKVVIEGRGLFIRDGKDGKIYDLLTRRVVE